jgi:hypothetical protein
MRSILMRNVTIFVLGCLVWLAATAVSAAARGGFALEFDGFNDYVEIGDPVNTTGPLTLEVWVRVDGTGGRIVSNRHGPNGFELDVSGSEFRFTINGSVFMSGSTTFDPGRWQHVAVTWAGPDTGEGWMFVDGEPVYDTVNPVTMNDAAGNLMIGRMGSGSWHFHGAIDELRIFAAVVDPEDIRTWMHRRIASDHPDFANLRAAWTFEEGAGQVVHSVVGPPEFDGRLGNSPEEDDADPTWITTGMVSTRSLTWGELKAGFRPSAR